MQIGMKLNKKSELIILTLILVSLAIIVWAAYVYYNGPVSPFAERPHPATGYIPGDFEFFYLANTILSTINIVLLVILIVNYASIYVKTRSEFTIGLLIFAGALLLKDLVSNPFFIGVFGFRPFGLGPFVLIPDIFEFAALMVLLYLSIEY